MYIYVSRNVIHFCSIIVIAILGFALVERSSGATPTEGATALAAVGSEQGASGNNTQGNAAVAAAAPAPGFIAYQGTLRDPEGKLPTGLRQLTFRIYDGPAATATKLWEETHAQVSVRVGAFSVLLGNGTGQSGPLSAVDFSSPERYIGITLAGFTEMQPRQRLTSVPFAFSANTANTANTATTLVPGAMVSDGGAADVRFALGQGDGVFARSYRNDMTALYGENLVGGYAVYGRANGDSPAVVAANGGTGTGLHGDSTNGTGAYGGSANGYGVHGYSANNDGVVGVAQNGGKIAVHGVNQNGGVGVKGWTNGNGPGVQAHNSGGGAGLEGHSGGGGPGVLGWGSVAGRFNGQVEVNGNMRIQGEHPVVLKRFGGLGDNAHVNTWVPADRYECTTGSWTVYGDINESFRRRHAVWAYVFEGWWHFRADLGSNSPDDLWDVDILCFRKEMTHYEGDRFWKP